MAPEYLRDDDGRPIFVRGLCAVFNQLRDDSHAEVLRPGCFDHVLKNPSADLSCQFHHEKPFTVGSLAADTLRFWSTDDGLWFQCGPFDVSGRSVSFLKSITSGEVRGASWSGWPSSSTREEIIGGQRVKVIRRFRTLDHVAPTCEPAYFDTGVWLSSERPDDMPPRIKLLAESWAASRPRHDTCGALRKMSRAVARLPRRAPVSRPAPSKMQARAAAVPSIWPMGFGLSDDEWKELAFDEDVARRALQDVEARKRVRQRRAA